LVARLQLTRRSLPAIALVAALGAPASAPTAAAGASSPRLLDDPRARIYIVDHVAPGAVVRRRIEVSNTTASAAHVSVYPAAATIAKSSFLGAADDGANELSTWTTVRPGRFARARRQPPPGHRDRRGPA